MSFVPTQALPQLLCVSCRKYLSQFPIYHQPSKGSFCGRCPIPTGPEIVRNKIYESLAEFQKFPCCYNSNGCTENLVPKKIPQHEKFCPYMKCDCPAFSSANCQWRGFVKDLPDHFETKHITFYLKHAQFELDFINTYAENCLLSIDEDLYIVNRSNNSKTKTFSCTVSYIGFNPKVDSFLYKIVLENEKKSAAHVTMKKLNEKSDFDIEEVKLILQNPSSIIATILVLEQSDIIENVQTEDDEENNSDINYDLLKELECTVCFEYMLPPIYQCITGHSICMNCKNSVPKCPTCQEEFKNTQNFALAQVIGHITYPCKHKRCRFSAKAKDIRKHEASCIFGPLSCPLKEYEDCHEEVIFNEIYDHLVNNHYENLLEKETVTLPFEMGEGEDSENCYILRSCSRLFKLHYRYQDGEFCWAMQLIGPAEESANYMFEIDIFDESGKNRRAYFKSLCSPLSESSSAFDYDNSFIYLDYEQIKSMITKDFTYTVRVSHSNE